MPSPLDPLGLTLDDGKTLLAGVQRHLVQARVAEYSGLRRHCSHCRGLRPVKDTRTRRLSSLFGTVEVPAPRFKPCRSAVAAWSTLCSASEIMPDRCTPEYERALAKMGAWLTKDRDLLIKLLDTREGIELLRAKLTGRDRSPTRLA